MSTPTATHTTTPLHPRGREARVLLASVFGPYAVDDGFGSREINPMELYHHQVTREQGAYSLRTFHRSWGLMMIQHNIDAPCTLLDYPTMDRFIEEISTHEYDVVGISAIPTNLVKVRRMCKLIRKHLPGAEIVLGGHITNAAAIHRWCDADHFVHGEGVTWMRRYLGCDIDAPIQHPRVLANIDSRIMGISLDDNPADRAATLIPAVGCPMGCTFCSTSAMFGGKGKSYSFFESAEDIFAVMCDLADSLDVQAFFVMDENFLFDRKRALRLLQLMEEHDRAWSLYVFSSANVLRLYTPDELVRLGISWVWIGLEGKGASYDKLARTDTHELIRTLQENGVRILGSSIIGLEEHTPENIDDAIEHAVSHDTEFHQFMLYTPSPGTPLYEEHERAGTLKSLDEINVSDIHGQSEFSFHHPHIKDGQETEFLRRAFERDLERNGPSILRICRTTLRAWLRFRDHPDPRVRRRFSHEAANLPMRYAGIVWAVREHLRGQPEQHARADELLREYYRAFGLRTRLLAPVAGRYILRSLRQEEERLAAGQTYDPPTFYEHNAPARALRAQA
jgi:hypothetical protein